MWTGCGEGGGRGLEGVEVEVEFRLAQPVMILSCSSPSFSHATRAVIFTKKEKKYSLLLQTNAISKSNNLKFGQSYIKN
jgi:hypothetical protein